MTEIVVFSQTAIQRPRGAYFVNKHDSFWKEENISFPKHHFFLKSIKKSTRKSKKSEKKWNFRENQNISGKSKIFEKIGKIMKMSKILDFFENFRFSQKIPKFSYFFSDFFDFLVEFFMDFKKFWCSGKFKVSSFRKVACLFMKYATLGLCTAFFEKLC